MNGALLAANEVMRSDYGYNFWMEIISRAQAIEKGLKRYFTGKACPNGHVAERFVSAFGCVVCIAEHNKKFKAAPESKEKRRQYEQENRDRILVRRKKWDAENREKINARTKAWNEANREKYLATVKRARLKKAADPQYLISKRMSDRLRWSLKTGKNGKSWRALVDYSIAELAAHLEKQFKPGMTWQNMGEWHIDHIVPIADFDFSSPEDEEFKACWALGNLRPEWAHANRSKGDKRLFLL